VVAIDDAGKEIVATTTSRMNEQTQLEFAKLPMNSVRELQFQVRRYRWVEFRGIALYPLERTNAGGNASAALYEEGIRLAEQRLADVKKRIEVGVMTPLDLAAAQRDLSIAEARGNPVRMAEAKVRYATEYVELLRTQKESGTVGTDELAGAESELNKAKQELQQARDRTSARSRTNPLESPFFPTEPRATSLAPEVLASLPPAAATLTKVQVRKNVILVDFAFDPRDGASTLMRARYDLPVDWNEALPQFESYGEWEPKGYRPALPRLVSKWASLEKSEGTAKLMFFVPDAEGAQMAAQSLAAFQGKQQIYAETPMFTVPDGKGTRTLYLSFKSEKTK
jgi:hypothetical protein